MVMEIRGLMPVIGNGTGRKENENSVRWRGKEEGKMRIVLNAG
jgi:hypothetical protein